MNNLKTITVVLAYASILAFFLALGAFTAQGVQPDGTRVTFTAPTNRDGGVQPDGTRVTFAAQTNPDTRDQSISTGVSPDSGTLTW